MLQLRSRVESVAERIGPDSFRDSRFRSIFAALLDADENASLEDLAPSLDPDSLAVAEDLMGNGADFADPQRTIDDCVTQLDVRDMEDRLTEIDRTLPLANDSEKELLHAERQKLVLRMRASGKMKFKAFRRRSSR